LHKTFEPNVIVLKKHPFTIERTGWGVFDIKIKIFFNPVWGLTPPVKRKPFEYTHTLSFKKDKQKVVEIILNPDDAEVVNEKGS